MDQPKSKLARMRELENKKDLSKQESNELRMLRDQLHKDPGAVDRMKEFERSLRQAGLAEEDNSRMADGGMAKGRGGKMYQHNYATGGQVVDHLSKPTGHPSNMMGRQQMERRMPQSVQSATALPGESPSERSKRLRSGG